MSEDKKAWAWVRIAEERDQLRKELEEALEELLDKRQSLDLYRSENIALKAEVERLRSSLEAKMFAEKREVIISLNSQLTAEREKNQKLVEALSFYASSPNYLYIGDGGNKARQAIEECGEGEK